ncbi:tyrosine-type recombinase/integrase [Aliarcobacter butzleri]|uniref:tyrosine-type recombinase/integrase n=1 Tax=Aliarcobacter butzleri TaxID=28197 RepID=UPI003AFAFB28
MALKKASSKYPGIFINEYKNGNVAYYINYRNEEGTPTLKKVGMKTKQSNYTIMDAYDRLIEVKHKIATGEELPKVVQRKAKVLFEDIFEDYLNWAKANKKTWKHNDLLVYNKHLSYLAKSDPRTLKPKDFEELKQRKLTEADKNGRVLAPKTVQHILATARHIFNHAIKNELIKNLTNPIGSGRVRMPKVENQKIGFFTKEKAKELLELLQQRENKRLYELTVLLLFTGARFSEVSRLTWSDINFNTNLIYFASSKDGNARYIKMSNRVLEVVNTLYKNKINNLVIPTINGNKYEKMPKEWQIEYVDKLIPGNDNANKDRLTTHSLRHTHASWLAQSGVDILHIKEQLGHKKIETTMRYSHLIDDRRHQATERLNF